MQCFITDNLESKQIRNTKLQTIKMHICESITTFGPLRDERSKALARENTLFASL